MAGAPKLADIAESHKEVMKKSAMAIHNDFFKWSQQLSQEASQMQMQATTYSAQYAAQLKMYQSVLLSQVGNLYLQQSSALKNSALQAAQTAVAQSTMWLEQLGFPKDAISGSLGNVPFSIVNSLWTGKLYDKKSWTPDKALWGDMKDTAKKLENVVACGIAMNKPVYEIANDVADYVNPDAKKPWNKTFTAVDKTTGELKKYHVYPKKVDYAAQRLVRTLSQHAYQQTMVSIQKDNPMCQYFRWHSIGGRACPLCQSRNGRLFKKDEVPLDHPNGMCILEPVYDENADDRLAAWINGADDPELDNYAKQLGFDTTMVEQKKPAAEAQTSAEAEEESGPKKVLLGGATKKEYTAEEFAALPEPTKFSLLFGAEGTSSNLDDYLENDNFSKKKIAEQAKKLFGPGYGKKSAAKKPTSASKSKSVKPKAAKQQEDLPEYIVIGGKKYTLEDLSKKAPYVQLNLMDEAGGKGDASKFSNDGGYTFDNAKMEKYWKSLFKKSLHPKAVVKTIDFGGQALTKEQVMAMDFNELFDSIGKYNLSMSLDMNDYTNSSTGEIDMNKVQSQIDKLFATKPQKPKTTVKSQITDYEVGKPYYFGKPKAVKDKNKNPPHYSQWRDMANHQSSRTFLDQEDKWESQLSSTAKSAIRKYTNEGTSNCYTQQNGFLRFGEDVSPNVKNTVNQIKKALDKSALPEDAILVRGARKSLYTDIFDGALKDALDGGNYDAMVGQSFIDPGFLSTSPLGGEFPGDLQFVIRAPAGTKAGYVENNNVFGEKEMIIQAGTQYYIEGVERNGNRTVLYMTVIGQP